MRVTDTDLEAAGMAAGPSHDIAHTCPVCHIQHEGVRDASGNGRVPSEGDLSICASCSTVLIFHGPDLRLRAPTAEEWDALEPDLKAYLVDAVQLTQEAQKIRARKLRQS